ncbi:uncharacterized protein LOC106167144 isoform X2 [Lingula anatina]|uniref:Uncharacterized protein LOC106167144 isoform X2 n=1 Tax=Lingula anatina TaxID=7574 RepID=A0A1S3IT98_LINAN|nr:uncharacterized protein LOC106167144 isoform X2 [Lingula anatina]|eukprot:XP_013401308.1 uncharacterized protein LOC106167144 isoform X2 [Lingula anatina]
MFDQQEYEAQQLEALKENLANVIQTQDTSGQSKQPMTETGDEKTKSSLCPSGLKLRTEDKQQVEEHASEVNPIEDEKKKLWNEIDEKKAKQMLALSSNYENVILPSTGVNRDQYHHAYTSPDQATSRLCLPGPNIKVWTDDEQQVEACASEVNTNEDEKKKLWNEIDEKKAKQMLALSSNYENVILPSTGVNRDQYHHAYTSPDQQKLALFDNCKHVLPPRRGVYPSYHENNPKEFLPIRLKYSVHPVNRDQYHHTDTSLDQNILHQFKEDATERRKKKVESYGQNEHLIEPKQVTDKDLMQDTLNECVKPSTNFPDFSTNAKQDNTTSSTTPSLNNKSMYSAANPKQENTTSLQIQAEETKSVPNEESESFTIKGWTEKRPALEKDEVSKDFKTKPPSPDKLPDEKLHSKGKHPPCYTKSKYEHRNNMTTMFYILSIIFVFFPLIANAPDVPEPTDVNSPTAVDGTDINSNNNYYPVHPQPPVQVQDNGEDIHHQAGQQQAVDLTQYHDLHPVHPQPPVQVQDNGQDIHHQASQ